MAVLKKLNKLKKIISRIGSCLIAYSGGADSTFLLAIAKECLGKKVLAVTAVSETFPSEELYFARRQAERLAIRHKIIKTKELNNKDFISNTHKRCYFCKRELFVELKKIANENQLKFVLDASSVSDLSDFRPGSIAKQELNVRSPLMEAGLTKEDIRLLSKKLGLSTWNKPSLACLASRIPYGRKITKQLLSKVNSAENYLHIIGIDQVRVRDYNDLCRIEIESRQLPRLLKRKDEVIKNLRSLGYRYITLDLEGYRTGSLNNFRI